MTEELDIPAYTSDQEIALAASICRDSFYHFFQEFWNVVVPDELQMAQAPNHIEYICNELQKIGERVAQRLPRQHDLIINVPPGTSKSSIATIMFPAWCWCIDPTIRFITASYAGSLSLEHAVKSRTVVKSEKYKLYFPDINLKQDQNNKSYFENSKQGSRIATSVGGTITGKHAHIILIDDPIDPEGAASRAELEYTNKWMTETLPTRMVDKKVTTTVLVMQRLHEEDPTGTLLKSEPDRIKHICLPASLYDEDGRPDETLKNLVSPPEAIEIYHDGYLDNTRLDQEVLDYLRGKLGSYGYSGQMNQRPTPAKGIIWQRWFIPVPDYLFSSPHTLKVINQETGALEEVVIDLVGTDWDLAYTAKEANSASAYITAGKYGNHMYIYDWGYDFLEFPGLVAYMKRKTFPHYIERKASGKSARQTLTDQGIPAIEVDVPGGGDKEARARLASVYAEGKLVYVRESVLERLYTDDRQGILAFPKASHDDVADALAQAIDRVLGKGQYQW